MRSHWYGNDFYSHANETQFHMNWKVLHLASFKVRVFGTRKWPIKTQANFRRICMESTEHKHHLNLSTNLHHPLIFRQVGIFHFLSDHPTQFNNFINLVFVTSSLLCSLPAIWCSSLSFFFRRLLSLLLVRQRSRIPEKKKKKCLIAGYAHRSKTHVLWLNLILWFTVKSWLCQAQSSWSTGQLWGSKSLGW